MNSVYFPAQVVLLLRRIVNVISTLSITNQYLLLKQANVDEQWATSKVTNSPSLKHTPPIESSDIDMQWPWWDYRRDWEWPRLVLWESRPVKLCQESTTRGNCPSGDLSLIPSQSNLSSPHYMPSGMEKLVLVFNHL